MQLQLRLWFALFFLGLFTATTFVSPSSFAYDGLSQTLASEVESSSFGYDGTAVLPACEKPGEVAGEHTNFGRFAEFLAAKTGVETAADEAAFWSGRQALNRAAAEASGLTTLEKTPAGIALESQDLFSKMPYSEAIKPWESLSKQYAQQAQGTVTAWTGGASPMSVWNRVELPTLRWNSQLNKIIINDATQPWKIKIIYK